MPDVQIRLTERQRLVVSFALNLFSRQAYAQAEFCAQKGPEEHVGKFLDDAKDADEIRMMLAAQGCTDAE